MSHENQFGGAWTEIKISILETYAKQFLTVFKNQLKQKLLYFDGFAGSGGIEVDNPEDDKQIIKGAAIRILRIDRPRTFNIYYFVEKKKNFASSLEAKIKIEFPGKECYVQAKDCNQKLKDLAKFLRSDKGKLYKVLGFIDVKDNDPINRLHEVYASRIAGNIFKYVSNPKILKNTFGAPLFHFFMATNSEIALRIANSVVNPKLGF